ncbi:potassium/sodium hyperpolarization-activated cyclic nucleotide-gated channel 4 [Megalopta genalis]|uniref:potassium/sodium hyperpolarization-activated cyclic nucleotide-gated channel 4 n=1 Tax=Megalopta genalis TaxID=115081 RepID=UPI003FD1507A
MFDPKRNTMTVDKLLKKRVDVHVCELPKTSQSNLPKLPPNAKFHARWRRKFQKFILVSENHPLTRNTLRSYAAIAFEKRRHGRSSFWWIIHPCSDFRFYWNILMTFIYLYLFITAPYIVSFHRIVKSTNPSSWTLIYPALMICIIDIGLNFITGFTSSEGHEIFLDPVLIARHYGKRYFFFDFISSVPMLWFQQYTITPPGPEANSLFLIPELLPTVKLVRIWTLRIYLRQITANFTISHAMDKALWIAMLMTLIFHWSCCFTHVAPVIFAHIDRSTMEESELYLIVSGINKKSSAEIYLQYLHMGVSNFFGSSFTELYDLSTKDTAVRCTILILGKGCLIYIIGNSFSSL